MSGVQSSAADGRPVRIPTREKLPPLLERTPLSIVDEAITFVRLKPAMLLGIAFTVLLPLRLVAAVLPGSGLRDVRPDRIADLLFANATSGGAVFAAFATLILDSLAVFVVGAIYAKVMAAWFSGKGPDATELLVWSIKRSPFLATVWIINHVLIFGAGIFSAGFGGVIIAILLMVSAPLMGAEDAGIRVALSRSMTLVSARLFSAGGLFVLAGAGGQLMRFILRLVPTLLGINLLPIPAWIISGVFDLIATTVVVSFTAATAVVLYLDLRVRKEGIDLDMAMDRVFPTSWQANG